MISLGVQAWRERRAKGGTVVMYHAVLARTDDPVLDEYAIDAPSFQSHLRFFRRTREVVPLRQLVEQLAARRPVPDRWIAITLDDAFSNQVTTAADILRSEGLPWALAVPAGLIGTGRSIWTHELRFLLMRCWRFPSVPWPVHGLAELPTRSDVERRAATRSLVAYLFELRDDRRSHYLEELIDSAGRGEFLERIRDEDRFALASWPQIKQLHEEGVELVSHGWHHRPQNASITPSALAEETVRSRDLIGERVGERPAGFALPHGAKSALSQDAIASAGYAFCLSSRAARLGSRDSPEDIPRFGAEYPLGVLRRHIVGQGPRPADERRPA